MGFGQYYLYCRLFERLVPGTTALASAGKAALDQLVHVPLLYFPLFYSIDALLQGAWGRGLWAVRCHPALKHKTLCTPAPGPPKISKSKWALHHRRAAEGREQTIHSFVAKKLIFFLKKIYPERRSHMLFLKK